VVRHADDRVERDPRDDDQPAECEHNAHEHEDRPGFGCPPLPDAVGFGQVGAPKAFDELKARLAQITDVNRVRRILGWDM
jgi:hypothetical protein